MIPNYHEKKEKKCPKTKVHGFITSEHDRT